MAFAPYIPTSWVNATTALSATNLNHLEGQYVAATQTMPQDLFTPFVYFGMVATRDGSVLNQLDVTAGTAYLLQTDGTIGRQTIASSAGPLTTSSLSTTYYLDLNPNGTYSFATSHSGTSNYLTICSCTTDGSGNILVVTDARVLTATMLSSSLGAFVVNELAIVTTTGLDALATGSAYARLYYSTGAQAIVYKPYQSAAGNAGHIFQFYNGSTATNLFSIGGLFGGALNYLDGSSNLVLGGALSTGQSATAVATATSGTITTAATGVSRVNPAGNITSVVLQAGTVAGQHVIVVNESAFTVTFAASGTSNVKDGVSDVIAATTARQYIWDSGTSLWYHVV